MDSSDSARSSPGLSSSSADFAQASDSLRELLNRVRLPEAQVAHIDALLEGLNRPLEPGESPRSRAELLREVLESKALAGVRGSNGQDLHAAALKALQEQKVPVTKERSAKAPAPVRGTRPVTKASPPLLGLLLVAGGSVGLAKYSEFWSLVVIAPSSLAILGGLVGIRGIQYAGVVVMGLVTMVLLGLAVFLFSQDNGHGFMFSGLGRTMAGMSAGLGLFLAVCAALLSRPWWRQETKPDSPLGR